MTDKPDDDGPDEMDWAIAGLSIDDQIAAGYIEDYLNNDPACPFDENSKAGRIWLKTAAICAG